ncbi:mutator mutT protein [Vibrio ishigakensis]|uniref:8-oxo-dGTP diphosphatase n=1 Tax=Vibrio ishigakensis TaxID=1481914 RepID=A0A0B8NSS7_9VIBR|nr:8-oxo-dGTP diphosphatase MutT [Vibrio ishigakensis]GAM54208.1 mutator mutT protein [Vibrio ishigakensis]GAM62688.1 mutator mutT protein [Vibrio ishigakensis]GAM67797.1 mutator mutT protein [Vibrio sp. JCM 19236]
MKRIHIVAGIILNSNKREIFITKRPDNAHKGGFWEFPGGKVENDELATDAMERELNEEIGISHLQQTLFQSFDFDYSDKSLSFDFFLIEGFKGEPYGKEGQLGRWVSIDKLNEYAFPEANQPVVEAVMRQFVSK